MPEAESNPYMLSLPWGDDLQVDDNGGLIFVGGREKIRQCIIRRFFTCPAMRLADGTYIPADYMFDTEYGFGAMALIGEPVDEDTASKYRAKIRASALIDQGTDVSREPEIELYQNSKGAIWARVKIFTVGDAEHLEIVFPIDRKNTD